MGQQQLLLLVLGIVIVGLAVVAGINAFSENQAKSNKDALINEGMRIATDMQAWKLKPSQFGGGGGDWTDFTLAKLGVDEDNMDGDVYTTPWGEIDTASPDDITLTDLNGNTVGTISITDEGKITYADEAAGGEEGG